MSYTDVIAYVGDGCIMCPTCAAKALVADVRSALPYSAKVLDRYDDETCVQVYARRMQRAPKLYRYHEDRTIESMKVGFNPDRRESDVSDLHALLLISHETEISSCSWEAFNDSADGEWCDCGAEIVEPWGHDSWWPSEKSELYDQMPADAAELFEQYTLEETCHFRRDVQAIDVERAMGRLIAEGHVLAVSPDEDQYALVYNEERKIYVAGCRRFTFDKAMAHWDPKTHHAPIRAAVFRKAIMAHHASNQSL